MIEEMKIWINKGATDMPYEEFLDAIIINVDVSGKSNISSDIREGWYKFGAKMLLSVFEDLYIIALSLFAVDKRVSRNIFPDAWTRTFSLNIPVIDVDRWNMVRLDLERIFKFLSGDNWSISFRQCTDGSNYQSSRKRKPVRPDYLNSIDCVSLFSGGLDSFCGAYELLSQTKNTVFVGFKEYGKLSNIQSDLMNDLDTCFPKVDKTLFAFTAKAYAPIGGENLKPENTSRSRSFLFLSAALCVAGIIGRSIPIYIPENGFIGLNLPMTPGRQGSCSTRTTHPHFLKMFNRLLSNVGIDHEILNPYAFKTKREMLRPHMESPDFIRSINKTISCSHPCNVRWQGRSEPENCGYCYPCLIRRSSLIDIDVLTERYTVDARSYAYIRQSTESTNSDLIDLLTAVSISVKSNDIELLNRIRKTGSLTKEEAKAFLRVYKKTINDIIQLMSTDPELLRIMGITDAAN